MVNLAWLATVKRVSVPIAYARALAGRLHTSTPTAAQKTSFSLSAPHTSPFVSLTIREWCARQDPRRVIGSYIHLNSQGVGCCPFGWHHAHGRDTRASFKVYEPGTPGGYCWYCYVWQQGGSVFDFLRYWYGLSARELWRRIQKNGYSARHVERKG